jgi:hypothetical protein
MQKKYRQKSTWLVPRTPWWATADAFYLTRTLPFVQPIRSVGPIASSGAMEVTAKRGHAPPTFRRCLVN